MRIAMTGVFVNDPIQAFKFYTETLGFVEKVYMPEAQLAIVASPEDPDGTSILLEPKGASVPATYQEWVYQAGLPTIVFGVDDIQTEFGKLKARGVVFTKEPTKVDWGIEAIFDDTCGNLIQLVQV